jgi:transposase
MPEITRKYRSWSVEEKQMIVARSYVPGARISEVAQRYNVNYNLLSKWRGDPRYNHNLPDNFQGSAGTQDAVCDEDCDFLSVKIEPPPHIILSVAGGHSLEITGAFDGDAVAALLRGLC